MSEAIPSELWTRIFLFACTDGGSTGCSLATVSRYFRAAVLPVQLHSVSLVSTKKTGKFADLLERRPPQHRRVRHLYLTRIDTRNVWRQRQISFDGVRLRLRDYDVLDRVLILIAPDLLTLSSTFFQDVSSFDRIFGITFPSLTELTVHGCSQYSEPIEVVEGDDGDWVDEEYSDPDEDVPFKAFPSLRYLHILSSAESCPLFLQHTPQLTHLRLSTALTIGTAMRAALLAFLRDNTAPDAQPFPSTLQHILIEPHAHALGRVLQSVEGFERIPLDSKPPPECCMAFAEADKEHKLLIVDSGRVHSFLPPTSYDPRNDWESRMVGGRGCWAADEDEYTRKFLAQPPRQDDTEAGRAHEAGNPNLVDPAAIIEQIAPAIIRMLGNIWMHTHDVRS